MIEERELERAMNFLAETDFSFAKAKAALENTDILRKRVRARVYLTSDGTVDARKAMSEVHVDTIAADTAYVEAVEAFEALRARRQRADLTVDVWRSLEASRRKAA